MALYGSLASLSTTASANAADGATDAPSTIDDNMNRLAAHIATLRDRTEGHAFSAYQSAAQTIPQNTFTKLQFQTEEYDYSNEFSTSTYRFQPTVPGVYMVSGGVSMATGPTALVLLLYKNGVNHKNLQSSPSQSSVGVYGTAQVQMNGTTDFLELYVSQNAAAQTLVTNAAATYFQAALIRSA